METNDSAAKSRGKPLKDALSECLESKQSKSPNYRQNLERVVMEWINFCEKKGVTTLEDVTDQLLHQYASDLARRVEAKQAGSDDGLSATTAWTYFDYISAFLSWTVRASLQAENPAEKEWAREPLPDRPSSGEYDRQFWSPEQRQTILSYVRRCVDSAYQEPIAPTPILHQRLRDRALVATIAYSGVRGGEVLKDPADGRRSGLRWDDVDLEDGVAMILGKNQDTEPVQFPEQVTTPLERWYDAYEPPNGGWPVFPSMHVPTLSRRIADTVGDTERDRRTEEGDYWPVALETEAKPPSLTTEGARSILKRLSKAAEVPDLDLENGEYLTLHGGRRGVGELLYREMGHQRAQRTLRHADPETTSKMYAHIDASELAEDNSEVFENE